MTRKLVIRAEADADIEAAFQWYEEQNRGLGTEFLRAVEASLSSIERTPELYPLFYRRARRILLRRFPYAVYYVVTPSVLDVVACMHTRRNPRRWRWRL